MTPDRDARGFPSPGTKWRRRTAKDVETRTVVDQTLGGSVVFVRGDTRGKDLSLGYLQKQCTLAAWNEWARRAKRIS